MSPSKGKIPGGASGKGIHTIGAEGSNEIIERYIVAGNFVRSIFINDFSKLYLFLFFYSRALRIIRVWLFSWDRRLELRGKRVVYSGGGRRGV